MFYKRVPRKKMLQLLSGIVLMIMNGRVDDVKQWGKHGNEEALLAMKTVGKKPSYEERKAKLWELLDEAILKMVVYHKPSTGELLIKSQSDWYPVFRMLVVWDMYSDKGQTNFCQDLEKLYKKLDKCDGSLAPCCKRKDLTQASAPLFERFAPLEWNHLSPKKWQTVRADKFNHYCDIVLAFKKLMSEQALRGHLKLEDLLPGGEDEDDEDYEEE